MDQTEPPIRDAVVAARDFVQSRDAICAELESERARLLSRLEEVDKLLSALGATAKIDALSWVKGNYFGFRRQPESRDQPEQPPSPAPDDVARQLKNSSLPEIVKHVLRAVYPRTLTANELLEQVQVIRPKTAARVLHGTLYRLREKEKAIERRGSKGSYGYLAKP